MDKAIKGLSRHSSIIRSANIRFTSKPVYFMKEINPANQGAFSYFYIPGRQIHPGCDLV